MKKDHHMHFLMSAEEYDMLCQNAKKAGLTKKAYMLKLLKGENIKARPSKELQMLYAEINKIGSNINQIARSVNAGIASEDDARRGLFMLDKVYDRLNEAVEKWR